MSGVSLHFRNSKPSYLILNNSKSQASQLYIVPISSTITRIMHFSYLLSMFFFATAISGYA